MANKDWQLRMKTHQFLTANGIPCTVVLDSAVAYVMERVDMVLVGSEAVVESGVCRFKIPRSLTAVVADFFPFFFFSFFWIQGPCFFCGNLPSGSCSQDHAETLLRPRRII